MSEEKKLTGLPASDPSKQLGDPQAAIRGPNICDTCEQPGRVVSNSLGVNVWCNKCKKHWPISSMARARSLPPTPPRGLSKQTLVEPDWEKAYESDSVDVTNEQVGPRRK